MPGQGEQAGEVLAFWFAETKPRQWFAKDPAFDALLRQRFLGLTRQAIAEGVAPEPRLLYTRDELREMRKLQAIAHTERNELESGQ